MVFLVAEIGVNWDGDFEIVKQMMMESKKAGFDAVKFQAFTETLVNDHPEKSRLLRSAITNNNVEKIDKLSKSIGIEWFCTPMYPDAVDFLDPFVKRFKIREKDSKDFLKNNKSELVEKVLKTKKEVIMSIETLPKESVYHTHPQIKWLYCVPKYPCNLKELDFRNLNDFDGFSNHCPNLIAPLSASILGTKIIELHITSNKNKNFVDNNISFDYNEMKELLRLILISQELRTQFNPV